MSAVPKKKYTEAEYLELERASDVKHEFYNGEIFAMAGASRQHNELKENLGGEIFNRLKGGPCRTYGSDQRVKVERTGLYAYPDYVIVCGAPQFEQLGGLDVLLNPQVVFELLSETTEKNDRGLKFLHYRRLPSMREYVLVSQDRKQLERYVRQPDDTWLLTVFDDPMGEFTLATVPVSIPLADIYRDVELTVEPL